MTVTTLDTHPERGIALVKDGPDWRSQGLIAYIKLADAPPMESTDIPAQVYLKQLHYIASHQIVGLWVHDRMAHDGETPPRHGWTRWKP